MLSARNLDKVYGAGVRVEALRNASLEVTRGEFVAIMGPSGSGKSTLLNILSGLEPPSAGQLLIDAADVGGMSDSARTLFRRRKIGFIFQQFNLLSIYSAAENVALPLRLERVPVATAAERAAQMLDLVGLAHRRDHLPSQLSGGEQQRVAIARALISDPALILADEPTGNLDSASGEAVITLLRRLVDERQQTLVMVTHDADVAQRADRIIQMRDGQIVDQHIAPCGLAAAGKAEGAS